MIGGHIPDGIYANWHKQEHNGAKAWIVGAFQPEVDDDIVRNQLEYSYTVSDNNSIMISHTTINRQSKQECRAIAHGKDLSE